MNNKKKILLATALATSCIMWACNDKSNDTKEKTTSKVVMEEKSTEKMTVESETKEPETDKKEEVVVNKEVVNNGGSFVKYGEDIYYWQYNSGSYENQGLLGYFSLVTD